MEFIDHILKAADKYGFAAVITVVLLGFIYRAGKWFGREFIVPVRNAMQQYLVDMTAWNRSLGEKLDKFQVAYSEHHAWEEERINANDQKLDRILDKVTRRLPRPNTDHGE
jgi:hypothetical protein